MTNKEFSQVSPKDLALLKIRLLAYKKQLREALRENVCPPYIKGLEEIVNRLKEEIDGAKAIAT